MQLIIPMSGQGSRFAKVGYTTLKPLILVDGKPIIEHVLNMFTGVESVIFICDRNHLETTNMRETLESIRPDATIISIDAHKKGPVHALAQAFDYVRDDEEVMVSYCDYAQSWDFDAFRGAQAEHSFSGAVPAYSGFHPHLLHGNKYAGIIADEHGIMQAMMEKHCFTENPEDSHHSSGSYFFKSGALLKEFSNKLIRSGDAINGEYYVSMIYPLMLNAGHEIFVPAIKHMMQWGTPEDLEEYEAWSRQISHEIGAEKQRTEIPLGREPFVRIPHDQTSDEYARSHDYWKGYFTSQLKRNG